MTEKISISIANWNRLLELANAHGAEMRRMNSQDAFAHVKDLVASGEVVIGIWNDPSQSDGVGALVIKGELLLPLFGSALGDIDLGDIDTSIFEVLAQAIPCPSFEHAVALRDSVAEEGRGPASRDRLLVRSA